VWGTYVHGLFDGGPFRRAFVNWVRATRGLCPAEGPPGPPAAAIRSTAYDRLAATLRESLDLAALRSITGLPCPKEVMPASI
jgi:adenosylcobyric acid synthase